MSDKFTNEKGSSLIELTMFMLLFIVFCFTTYTIICAGSMAQQKITDDRDVQIDVRIALSYLDTKLRQNDEAGKISIEKNPIDGRNAVLIKNREEGSEHDTWIYSLNDTIYEFLGLPDESPDENLSIPIMQSEGLLYEIGYNADTNSIDNTIKYDYSGEKKELSSIVHLRSDVKAE